MKIYWELLIIFGVAIFNTWYNALVCFRDRNFQSRCGVDRTRYYILDKGKIWFLPIYLTMRNWKSGVIKKTAFWGVLVMYAYYTAYGVATIIYRCVAYGYLIEDHGFIFVLIMILVPDTIPGLIRWEVDRVRERKLNN